MDDLDFISDTQLRTTLENSIEYVYTLYEQSKKGSQKPLYQEETYRVIILYVVSVIEAVLLFFYKERGEEMEVCDYKFIQSLPPDFNHKQKKDFPIVVAVQEKTGKKDHQIGLHDLVTFFLNKKLIRKRTAEDILALNEVRNTLHFSKPRTKKCDTGNVELAFSLLVHTIKKAPLALKKN